MERLFAWNRWNSFTSRSDAGTGSGRHASGSGLTAYAREAHNALRLVFSESADPTATFRARMRKRQTFLCIQKSQDGLNAVVGSGSIEFFAITRSESLMSWLSDFPRPHSLSSFS